MEKYFSNSKIEEKIKNVLVPAARGMRKQVRKVKEVKWLLPGWAGYEYYKNRDYRRRRRRSS